MKKIITHSFECAEFGAAYLLKCGKKKKAFSLIELLVSLIIISLITTAFAPIITKKVKASILSVTTTLNKNIYDDEEGGGKKKDKDKNEEYVDPSCLSGPNEECCKKLDSQFVSSKNTPGYSGEDICVLKYNAGDDKFIIDDEYYHPEYAKIGIQMLDTGGVPCASSGYCCFKGTTASSATSAYSYSGQGRSVCQSQAATLLCANWAPRGSKKGSWRLPTQAELIAFSNASAKDKAGSAKFSKYLDYEGLQLCDYLTNAYGSNKCTHNTNCPGAYGDYCMPETLWGQNKSSYWLYNGNFVEQYSGIDYAKSVRCVNSHPGRVINKAQERIPEENEPKSQQDCDPYNAIFIEAKHTGTRNVCMTKYNTGDGDAYFDFGRAGVQLSKGGQSCTSAAGCCWQGDTGNGLGYYSYSGQNRTVCTYAAAKRLCENHAPKGASAPGKWRLLTASEMVNLAKYIMAGSNNSPFLSKYLDKTGIQLCDYLTNAYGSNKCTHNTNCPGAYGDYCMPETLWAEGKNSYWLYNGVFYEQYSGIDYAKSVRCVTDNINYTPPEPLKPTGYESTQADCDEIDAVFIERKYAGSKNLCMTKENPGEGSIPFDFGRSGVQLVKGGQPCSSIACCWQGNTASNVSGYYSYSGQNRTVCTYEAAKRLCENYRPNPNYGANWRLPSASEMANFGIYFSASGHLSPFLSKYVNDTGLQLCDYATGAQGANQCTHNQNCPGSSKDEYCMPETLWGDNKISYWLYNGTFYEQYSGIDYAKSVRCVSDSVRKPDNSTPRTLLNNEPRSQEDCDNYNALFIDAKYTGSTNICMTKTNFADKDGGVVIGANTAADYQNIGVKVVNAGNSCSGACCWMVNTADTTTGTYSYSGFGRTVCNYAAAEKLCENYAVGKPSTAWRLITPSEMNVLATYITGSGHLSPFLSKYANDKGLQLCDYTTSAQGSNQCTHNTNCPGAYGSYCMPETLWAKNKVSYWLYNGTFYEQYSGIDYAKSVRCVTDKVKI